MLGTLTLPLVEKSSFAVGELAQQLINLHTPQEIYKNLLLQSGVEMQLVIFGDKFNT